MKRQWIAALGVFAWSVEAHSAGEPSYQFDDLLAERIVVQIPKQPAKAELVLHVEGCEAKIPVGAGAASVELDRKNTGKCSDRIFKESTPHMLSLDVPGKPSITVSPPQVAPEKARVLFADGSAQGAQALPANSLLFVFTGEDQNPWIKVPLDEGKFKIPESVTSHVKQGAEVVYYLQTGLDFNRGKFSNDQLVQNGRSGTDSSASRSNSPSTLLPKGEPMRCERGNVPASTLVICVDFLSAEAYPEVTYAGRKKSHVIRPNQDVVVKVRHPGSASVAIEMSGVRGLFSPATRNLTNTEMRTQSSSSGEEETIGVVVTTQEFAPRKPGDADITVRLTEKDKPAATYPIELIVEETYSGAVRLGIGLPFGGAQDAKYGVVTRSGSSQAEIVAEQFGVADLELVVGYSAYLETGGRSATRGCYPLCVNPTFGIGVYAPDAQGVKFIKSAYVGAELELSPNFSASIDFVARRVTRLQDGYHVGSAVTGSEAPVRNGIGFGGGLVLTFSPDFLRLARPAASSFLE